METNKDGMLSYVQDAITCGGTFAVRLDLSDCRLTLYSKAISAVFRIVHINGLKRELPLGSYNLSMTIITSTLKSATPNSLGEYVSAKQIIIIIIIEPGLRWC